MKETLFENAIVVTQNRRREVFRGWVHVMGDRIAAIGKGAPKGPLASNRNLNRIDARGQYLLPGFVQAHIHLCQTLFRNRADDLELLDWLKDRIWPFEASHTRETLEVSALLGIHELLASGTTCILDMGTVRHTEAIISAAKKSGIRANIGKCLMDHPKSNPRYLQEDTESALKEAEALFLKHHGSENDRIRISFAPRFALSCTETLMQKVGELARRYGAIVHTHANENLKELVAIRKQTGHDNIRYLEKTGLTGKHLVLAHGVWLKAADRKIIKKHGCHIVHCPGSNLKLASGIAPIPEYLKAKMNIALGADGAPCNNSLNAFNEMRLAALIHKPKYGPKAMPATDVLDLATLGGAKALGWENEIGSIEAGKKADLILVDLDRVENRVAEHGSTDYRSIASAVVYSGSRETVTETWVDGKRVARGGKVLTLNEKQILKRAAAADKTIRDRKAKLASLF